MVTTCENVGIHATHTCIEKAEHGIWGKFDLDRRIPSTPIRIGLAPIKWSRPYFRIRLPVWLWIFGDNRLYEMQSSHNTILFIETALFVRFQLFVVLGGGCPCSCAATTDPTQYCRIWLLAL